MPKSRIQQYKRNGYITLRQVVPVQLIRDVVSEVDKAFSNQLKNHFDELPLDLNEKIRLLYQQDFNAYLGTAKLCNHLSSLYLLGINPKITAILQELGLSFPTVCARPVMWFHSSAVASTERYAKLPPHQEWSNMQGSLDGAVVWIPLTQITEEMGKLQAIPGSHLRGLLEFSENKDADYPFDIDDEVLKEKDFVELDVKLGDLLVFSSFLVHRSGHNRTKDIRLTTNFRFNNADEKTFIRRDFLNPYKYEVAKELYTMSFPKVDIVKEIFE
tara:strand:+ start:60 stop:875 length:816 start_codon:yes stop_codon:yes gene_type:complete